jgi:RHS repeat-associated protein
MAQAGQDTQAECLFNWAEKNYASLFAPSGTPTVFSPDSTSRHYSATNANLRVSTANNHVYYQGQGVTEQDVGSLSDWLPKAGCPLPPSMPECLFNWAEKDYPSLFAPAGSSTAIWDVYTYRHYSATNAYLGVSSVDFHAYYLGPDGNMQNEGPLSDWTAKACRSPFANAGADQTALVGATVTLDGSASTDPDGNSISYLWTLTQKPANSQASLVNPTALHSSLAIDKPGTYKISLVVNDGYFDSTPSTVTINTQNSKPVVNAGPDQTLPVGATVQLDGSGSTDVDGDPLSFSWTIISTPPGSQAPLGNPNQPNSRFNIDKPGVYRVQLVVNDGHVNSVEDIVTVTTSNSKPVANAGADQTAVVGKTVALTGIGSTDVDGDPLTYLWSLTVKPSNSLAQLSDLHRVNPTVTLDQPGHYVAQLTVNDSHLDGEPDTVEITTENSKPVANAGPDQTAKVNDTVALDGSGSKDADHDSLSYFWSMTYQPAGSLARINNPNIINPHLVLDLPGSYIAQLIVNDGKLASDPSTMTVTTQNSQPLANAGNNQSVNWHDVVQLDGSASSDADKDPLTYRWVLLSRPTSSNATLSDETAQKPSFVADQPGTYVAQLIVNDGHVDSVPATVGIQAANVNEPPHITSQPVTSGTVGQAYSYQVTATDPENDTLSYSLTASPSGMTINASSGLIQWTLPSTGGPFAVTVNVSDGKGGAASQPFQLALNHHPQVTTTPITTGTEGQAYSYPVIATDVDSNTLTFSLTTSPTGMTINPATGLIQWTLPSTGGPFAVTVNVSDGKGGAASQSFQLAINHNPQISSTPITEGTEGQAYSYQVTATDPENLSLIFSLTTAPNGMAINPSSGLIEWAQPTVGGPFNVAVTVTDGNGGTGTQAFAVQVTAIISNAALVPQVTGLTRSEGESLIQQNKLNLGTASFQHSASVADGRVIQQTPAANAKVSIGTAVDYVVSLGPDTGLPPNPATIAPAVDPTVATTVSASTQFLYSGSNPIQTGVAPGTIEARRAAVIRGRVLADDNQALPGVIVTILNHPELGQTKTRSDGAYDLAVNGGGQLTVVFNKDGYLPSQRNVLNVPWQGYAVVEDAVLIAKDSKVTTLNLNSPEPMKVAQGSVVTDSDGQRQATLMIPQGVTAQVYNPDGTTRTVSQLHFRATEYTVGPDGPKKMPGPLPPTSGYTYAVELSADEAITKIAGKDVLFSQPVPFYVDNFLNMPVGIQVPVAYWDKTKNAWIPSDDGKVIKILSITNGLADIDADGDGVADDATKLSALSITAAEREKLAGYPVGKTLWRAMLAHLSTYDCNYLVGPQPGATPPNQPPPKTANKDKPDKPSCSDGSIIECQSQTLGETLPITGTGLSLNYRSDRTLGNRDAYSMTIPLSGSFGAVKPKYIELEVTIAGKTFKQNFPANPNQTYTYTWDGLDAFGRPVLGQQTAIATTSYFYDAFYNMPPELSRSFGAASGQRIPGNIRARDWLAQPLTQTSEAVFLGMPPSFSKLGGWQLSAQHHYDPIGKILYMGDGQRRSVYGAANDVITTVAGNGIHGYSGDGGPATQAKLWSPSGVAVGADGSLYIADWANHRIRRVASDGIITTVAGNGICSYSGDVGPATQASLCYPSGVAVSADGSVYIADSGNHRIRRVAQDGIITTVAGNGTQGYSGDGGPATQAGLYGSYGVDVGADGSLYIAESSNHRIRRVAPDGIITTVAGNGTEEFSGDGGPATQASLYFPYALTVGADGSLFIADRGNHRIRRVSPDGIITTVVGNGTYGRVDGGPATQTGLIYPSGLAVGADGSLYIAESINPVIRRVGSDGIITTVAGTGATGNPADGVPATKARLQILDGVAIGPDGSVYAADNYDHRIRRISPTLPGFGLADIAIPSEDGAEIYRFDRTGKHLSTRNALTGATLLTFGYDSQGRLVKVTDANGNITTIERNALGEPTAIIAPFGQRTELRLDGNGYLASATNPAGEAYAMTYTADGLMTAFKDPRGNASTFTYDELGRLTKDQNAAGGFQTLARQTLASGYEVTRSTSENLKFNYKLENLSTGNRLMTNTAADGTQISQLEQTDGTTQTTLPDGTVNTVVQGPDPRYGMQVPIVTSQTMTTGGLSLTQTASRTQTLSDPNNILSTTSLTDIVTVNSRTATRVYTVANKTETTTSAAGRISTRTLDAVGRVASAQVTGIAAVNNSYDAQGRLSKISQGTGADERLINLAYNPQGYLASIADAYGRTGSFTYDLAGRVTQQTLPDGSMIDFTYDKNGNLASLTPPGQPPHLFNYDGVDQPQEYVPPDVAAGLNSTRYQYNTDKQLTKITRPDTLTVNFAYDSAGRLSQLTTPDGATTYSYNASTGKLVKTTTPDNIALFFTYNGALMTQTGWNLVGGASPTFTVGYGYDNDFRVNTLQVNGANPVSLQYDADSLLTQAGDLTLNRSAQNGLLTGTTLGKQTDSLSYNGFGEMTQYAASYDGTGQFKTVFTRDKLGRITQKQETLAGVTDVYDYTYDTAGRLAEVKKNNLPQAKYTYDANGNRLKYEGAFVAEGTYDAQDRLITYGGASYSYTANGELKTKTILPSPTGGGAGGEGSITTYAYDVLGNLRHVELSNGNTLDYVIDGQNRRIGKKVNGVLKQTFLWQDQLKPIAELDGSGNLVARFVYATGVNVPDYLVKGGITYRLVKDHLGSPRLVVRVSDGFVIQRMDYDEFGNVLMDTNPGFQPFGFAGGLYDRDTGLVRFGARDYDAGIGRWTAKDPIGFRGGTNFYGYAWEDPMQYFDPFGLDVRAYLNQIHIVYEIDTSRGLTSFGFGPKLGGLGEAAALVTSPFPIPFIPGEINEGYGYGQRGGKLLFTLPLSKEQGDIWAKEIRDLAKTNPPYHTIHQNCSSLGGFFRSP